VKRIEVFFGGPVELTYGEIELLLRYMHRVHDERRIALVGRIKHFQRLGWPKGTNLGKGTRVRYDARQTLSLLTAFELLQCGLPPERAVNLLRPAESFLPVGFLAALARDELSEGPASDDLFGRNPDAHIFLSFDANALRTLQEVEPSANESRLSVSDQANLDALLSDDEDEPYRRTTLINMTALLEEMFYQLERVTPVNRQQVRDALRAWRDEVIDWTPNGNDPEA
jgi:hypothetical protein